MGSRSSGPPGASPRPPKPMAAKLMAVRTHHPKGPSEGLIAWVKASWPSILAYSTPDPRPTAATGFRKGRMYHAPNLFRARLISSPTTKTHGIRKRVIPVANSTPKASETAIGIKNWAWRELSNINGTKPTKVVTEVGKMGRKRRQPDS